MNKIGVEKLTFNSCMERSFSNIHYSQKWSSFPQKMISPKPRTKGFPLILFSLIRHKSHQSPWNAYPINIAGLNLNVFVSPSWLLFKLKFYLVAMLTLVEAILLYHASLHGAFGTFLPTLELVVKSQHTTLGC